VNTAETRVRGLDWSTSYQWDRGADTFTLDTAASFLFDYKQALTPAAQARELVSTINFPVDFRATVGGTWQRADWLGRIALNHVSAFEDAAGRTVEAWNTIDANLHWTPASPTWADGLRISLNVLNVLDADPPFYDAPSGIGFDPGQANPLGRTVSLQLTQRW
jgi:iron complex outermembrane recepter protein